MNSLMSETKVVCNDSIPNPIAPVPIPISVSDSGSKSITVLSGAVVIKNSKEKIQNGISNGEDDKQTEVDSKDGAGDENCMNTDTSTDPSNESSLSPSEPMDCNCTPNISPAHGVKAPGSNEDVAMSETSVKEKVMNDMYLLKFFLDI